MKMEKYPDELIQNIADLIYEEGDWYFEIAGVSEYQDPEVVEWVMENEDNVIESIIDEVLSWVKEEVKKRE